MSQGLRDVEKALSCTREFSVKFTECGLVRNGQNILEVKGSGSTLW